MGNCCRSRTFKQKISASAPVMATHKTDKGKSKERSARYKVVRWNVSGGAERARARGNWREAGLVAAVDTTPV